MTSSAGEAGVRAVMLSPTRGTPGRRPRSVRRTITVDGLRPDGADGPIVIKAVGRDLVSGRDGAARVVGNARAVVAIESMASFTVTAIDSHPAWSALPTLVGESGRHGFRRRVAALQRPAGGQVRDQGLLARLLEDVPVAAGLSHLAFTHAAAGGAPGMPDLARQEPNVDICSGWAAGSTMVQIVSMGRSPVEPHVGRDVEAPELADPGDPLGWHSIEPLAPMSFRRRRRNDLTIGATGEIEVDCHFRDTYRDVDGIERVEHEYTVTATADRRSGRIRTCVATPHVLPAPECPNAAASAGRLVGMAPDDVRQMLRAELRGPTTCTHLTEVLHGLADIGDLSERLG